MLIQCTVPRRRTVTLGDSAYTFTQDEQGRFVAEVTNKRHIARLMEIDVYRSLGEDEQEPEKEPEPTKKADQKPEDTKPEDEDSDGEQPDDDQDDAKDEQNDTREELDRDELAKLYEAKFSKKPHHKLSAARIKQILEEA